MFIISIIIIRRRKIDSSLFRFICAQVRLKILSHPDCIVAVHKTRRYPNRLMIDPRVFSFRVRRGIRSIFWPDKNLGIQPVQSAFDRDPRGTRTTAFRDRLEILSSASQAHQGIRSDVSRDRRETLRDVCLVDGEERK